MARHSIYKGMILTAALSTASCDSTVWLDDTLPSLTAVYASGACQNPATPNEIDLSVVLVNQGDSTSSNILPTTRVATEGAKPVEELITSGSFKFNQPPIMKAKIMNMELTEGVAYAEPEDGLMIGAPKTVGLEPRNVSFEWASPDPEAGRTPLLILLMDQSSSVLGLPPSRSAQMYGSDISHQRVTFFSSLIKTLDENYEVALLTFSGFTSNYGSDDSMVNTPTLNRDQVTLALEDLKYSTAYDQRTPLNQAISDTKTMIESLPQDTYDPVVVVFTDGVEGGDNSMGAPEIEALAPFFVERHIPVHTIQLQAKEDPAGDMAEEDLRRQPLTVMSQLACQTGGDFYFIRKPEEFTNNNDLGTMLRNRLTGRWSLKVQTTAFSELADSQAPGIMLTTELEASLAGEVERFNAAQNIQGQSTTTDNRLWILKTAQ